MVVIGFRAQHDLVQLETALGVNEQHQFIVAWQKRNEWMRPKTSLAGQSIGQAVRLHAQSCFSLCHLQRVAMTFDLARKGAELVSINQRYD